MAKTKYKTVPTPTTKAPPGIWHILTNEATERFAYYGMTLILVEFMTKYLLGPNGALNVMTEGDARSYYHWIKAITYAFPLIGAIISDIWLGKFRTIIYFSILYWFGFLAIIFDQTRLGLFWALLLVAIGSGIIKPCVSANVGDQFGKSNQHLMARIYNWFYFSVNFGAFFGPFITPKLMNNPALGPKYAFGLTALVMLLAIVAFWMGRKLYVHVPPAGIGFVKEVFSGESLKIIVRLAILYVVIAAFFALFELNGSAWILQAEKLNRHWLGYNWAASQVPSLNALFVMILIPLFAYIIYPAINNFFPLTALRKIGIGMFFTIIPFLIVVWIEKRLEAGFQPSVGWQVLANFLLTAAEVMVSIPCLEFSYTQSPKKIKSFIMSIYLLSISLGNVYTATINDIIKDIEFFKGANFYWLFIGFMLTASIIFVIAATLYRGKTYMQDEAPENSKAQKNGV